MPIKIITMLLILMLSSFVSAQDQDAEMAVVDVDLKDISWGYQDVDVTVRNLTDYIKFLIVDSEILFEGKEGKFNRLRTHYLIEPSAEKKISPRVFVPGNFGKATVSLRFYDVVDTLDIPYEGQIFFNDIKPIEFNINESLKQYSKHPLTLPPRLSEHPMFSSDFTKLFILLLDEGKSIEEIAALTKSDTAYVNEQARMLNSERFLNFTNNQYTLRFPLIKHEEARKVSAYVDSISSEFADLIAKNMPKYLAVRDSMVQAGSFPADSNDFIKGSTLYMRPYPMISSLLLWYELGNKFITRSAPLVIYDGTDICNAMIYQYMYAVEGGDEVNGHHFYSLWLSANNYVALWSEQSPKIKCDDDFIVKKKQGKKVKWRYDHPSYPEFFLMDTTIIRPLINALADGSQPYLEDAYKHVRNLSKDYGHSSVSFGYRYWLWNLIATKTLDKLVEQKVIEPYNDNYYRFDSIKRK